jgi:hypothetical protein
LAVHRFVGFSAADASDWGFCRQLETIRLRGEFDAAGRGEVAFHYCAQGGHLRIIQLGILSSNSPGLARLSRLQSRMLTATTRPNRSQPDA